MSRKIGNLIEEYACDTYNLQSATHNNYYDALLMNIPIEIKGILKHHNNKNNKNGRVWITNTNHQKLILNHGVYLFIVYDYPEGIYDYDVTDYTDLDIRYILFIAAYRIKINNGSNSKITYKKLLELLEKIPMKQVIDDYFEISEMMIKSKIFKNVDVVI